jgi:hypothetical protein
MVESAQQIRHFEAVVDWEELSGILEIDKKKATLLLWKEKLIQLIKSLKKHST